MNFNNTLPVILSLIPLVFGAVWKLSNGRSTTHKSMGLIAIGVLAGGLVYMQSAFESEASLLQIGRASCRARV